jgi:hypothetical protein
MMIEETTATAAGTRSLMISPAFEIATPRTTTEQDVSRQLSS